MNSVNLFTYNNSPLKARLEDDGFIINEFNPGALLSDIKNISGNSNKTFSLFEIKTAENGPDSSISEKLKFLYQSSRLICIAESVTPDLKNFFFKTGIADCITDYSPERISLYLKSLSLDAPRRSGTFLILDDDETRTGLLKSIIQRFGYKTITVTGTDELYGRLNDPDIIMVLINIGTSSLDLNGLVRRSFTNSDIRKNPVVAYKSMDHGLFVHEVINGLNRLTKVILSPEELCCMLADMLFKKTISSYTNDYINSLKYEKYHTYSGKSLQQIYYEYHGDPCSQESVFEKERIDSMLTTAESIKNILVRAEGIIWIKHNEDYINRATCGAGA